MPNRERPGKRWMEDFAAAAQQFQEATRGLATTSQEYSIRGQVGAAVAKGIEDVNRRAASQPTSYEQRYQAMRPQYEIERAAADSTKAIAERNQAVEEARRINEQAAVFAAKAKLNRMVAEAALFLSQKVHGFDTLEIYGGASLRHGGTGVRLAETMQGWAIGGRNRIDDYTEGIDLLKPIFISNTRPPQLQWSGALFGNEPHHNKTNCAETYPAEIRMYYGHIWRGGIRQEDTPDNHENRAYYAEHGNILRDPAGMHLPTPSLVVDTAGRILQYVHSYRGEEGTFTTAWDFEEPFHSSVTRRALKG